MQKQKIKLTLPANLKYSSLVRKIAEEIFNYVGFSKDWSNRLELVADELFMNANQYGSRKEGGMIFILFSFDDQEVVFRIEDEGGDRKLDAEQLRSVIERNYYEAADMSKTRGRGLALISNLWTDGITVEDSGHGGVAITFTKKITDSPPSTAPFFADAICPINRYKSLPSSLNQSFETIGISGEIDLSNIDKKIEPIVHKIQTLPKGFDLHLDCAHLVYINSTFIGHLVTWLNAINKNGGHLIMKSANQKIREVLELVGVSELIYFQP